MIELTDLQELFAHIAEKTDWDMNGPMLWGYFFTDSSVEKLEAASEHLEEKGYSIVKIFVPDLEDDEEEYFILHMEKVETHTPESLYKRNKELEAFAESQGIESYDGMDVGPENGDDDVTDE